jgi:hypothetical protein
MTSNELVMVDSYEESSSSILVGEEDYFAE